MSERAPLQFGTVVVVGGGCYGSYYVRQLQRALASGAVQLERLVVVDRNSGCQVAREVAGGAAAQPSLAIADWTEFFDGYLGGASADPAAVARDAIVPSPLMPHLLFSWLVARMRERWPAREVRTAPLTGELAVPWQRAGDDGTHYVSYATWMCPINCIEPARCPHTRGPRDWTMPAALQQFVDDAAAAGSPLAGPYVFHCVHRAYGVGMIDVASVLAADADLAHRARRQAVEALVGTVSHCHGAVGRLVLGDPVP